MVIVEVVGVAVVVVVETLVVIIVVTGQIYTFKYYFLQIGDQIQVILI